MKFTSLLLAAGLFVFCVVYSCQKSSNPTPPVHDTTVIVKTDTVIVLPPPDSTINLKKGLLLYLPFDGNIADSSGNGNPTTAVGGNVLTYDAHGYANQAFGGNGTGQRIKVTNNGSIQFDTAFSLSFDFMINASQRQFLVTMVNPANAYGASFGTNLAQPGIPNLVFSVFDSSGSCDAAVPGGGISAAKEVGDTAITPQPGSWYNVIHIYHKGTIYTYINGQLVTSIVGQGTAALLCPESQVIIGGFWDGDPATLNGSLDEIRLYNRVLTPHEIATLAQHFQVTSENVGPKMVKGK